MQVSSLTKEDKKKLRRLLRPTILLSTMLITVISIVNFTFYYRDILTGTEGLGRPPFAQLMTIEIIAIVIGTLTLIVMTRLVLRDLINGIKSIEYPSITHKFVKLENNKRVFSLKLNNKMIIGIDKNLFENLMIGEKIHLEYAPNSFHVLSTERIID